MKQILNKNLLKLTYFIVGLFLISACANPNFVHNKVVKRKVHSRSILDSEPLTLSKLEAIDSTSTDHRTIKQPTDNDYYLYALIKMNNMLIDKEPLNFKKAVYLSENAYYSDSLSYEKFDSEIQKLKELCQLWMNANKMESYHESDSIQFKKNAAIYTLMKDTIFLMSGRSLHNPFEYNFDDYLARNDWSNQFVSQLLYSKKGNCHSLPYLYKILSDELKTQAYLSFAPNHIYIKQFSKQTGWYNTELTSGGFPTDAWIKASGYITIDAIKNGIYMDTLSDKQAIASCIYDLAKSYLIKTGNYNNGFVITCCDIVLNQHPQNINARILLAETIKKNYNDCVEQNKIEEATIAYNKMQKLYVDGINLGYREMPFEMYQSWLISLSEQKEKYANAKIKTIFNEHE